MWEGPYPALGFVILVGIVYFLCTKLIDHYYRRKAEFVDDLKEKMEGTDGQS
jgi:hypothetical protein